MNNGIPPIPPGVFPPSNNNGNEEQYDLTDDSRRYSVFEKTLVTMLGLAVATPIAVFIYWLNGKVGGSATFQFAAVNIVWISIWGALAYASWKTVILPVIFLLIAFVPLFYFDAIMLSLVQH